MRKIQVKEVNRNSSPRKKLCFIIAKSMGINYKAECSETKNKVEDDRSSSTSMAAVIAEKSRVRNFSFDLPFL
jgi:hypothetical protein